MTTTQVSRNVPLQDLLHHDARRVGGGSSVNSRGGSWGDRGDNEGDNKGNNNNGNYKGNNNNGNNKGNVADKEDNGDNKGRRLVLARKEEGGKQTAAQDGVRAAGQ